jgi:amino acid transporter
VITAGVAVSAFGSALASTTGAARLVYAFARDGVLPHRLAAIEDKHRIPQAATTTVVLAVGVIGVVLAAVVRLAPFDVFADGGAVGVLILLPVYGVATIGAAKLLFVPGPRQVARWEVAVPALALLVLLYTLYRNVIPYPSGPAAWFPILAAAWLLAGVAWAFLRPAAAERAGTALARDEGLSVASSTLKLQKSQENEA